MQKEIINSKNAVAEYECSVCKAKNINTVLKTCFHVFCYDCLENLYDSRQRSCPKCNTKFGQMDNRELFLS